MKDALVSSLVPFICSENVAKIDIIYVYLCVCMNVRVYVFLKSINSLQWRHNDHDGVSYHQPHGCLLNRLFRRRSKKTSKLRVSGLCVGNSPGPVHMCCQLITIILTFTFSLTRCQVSHALSNWLREQQRSHYLRYPNCASPEAIFPIYLCFAFTPEKNPDMGYGPHPMMTSSNGNIFRVTGHLCGEFTGPSNYIFIMDLTSGFNELGKDICKTRRETFQIWDLGRVILEILR